MRTKDTFATYAQYNEDIILAALFSNMENGFYVDVGANHETYHSVTKYFYERGWKGINIEPIPRLIAEFEKKRKRDINLQLAISINKGKLELRDYPEYDGLSTLSDESKNDPTKIELPHEDYTVDVNSLKNVFKDNSVSKIDFLKIDVEGYEFEVLKSNDWEKYRPTIVCIEANHRSKDWSTYLEVRDYTRVIFDGLNEYYLANESSQLFNQFAERAALLAHNGVRHHHIAQWDDDIVQWAEATTRIKFLEDVTDRQDALIKSTQQALESTTLKLQHATAESLSDKSLLERVRLAFSGLTVGYYRYRKSRRKL